MSEKSLQVAVKNKKVIGAVKNTVDGIRFDSKLESYLYGRLKMFKVEMEMQKRYELLPKFRYLGKGIQDIEIVVDFYLPKYNAIVDTKGWQTSDNKIKMKMLKHLFVQLTAGCTKGNSDPIGVGYISNTPPRIFLPSSKAECDKILIELGIVK